MARGYGGQPSFQDFSFPFLLLSPNTFVRSTKVMTNPLFCSRHFSLNLSQGKHHISGSPIGPKTTLALWEMFFCNSENKLVQQYSCYFAVDGEKGFPQYLESKCSPLFLSRVMMSASRRSCGSFPCSQQQTKNS